MNKNITINLPPYINITILVHIKKYIILHLYNSEYYINYNIKNLNFFYKYDIETNSLTIFKLRLDAKNNLTTNYTNAFLKSLDINFFFKIKFKGKGYRIRFYKKNKIVKFHFGKSHLTLFFFKNIIMKKITKYKFVIKSPNFINLKKTAISINKIKPVNIYTLRGLRISRQKILKRKGKKGSYI
jgi:ribosomal protein L6P/L9E